MLNIWLCMRQRRCSAVGAPVWFELLLAAAPALTAAAAVELALWLLLLLLLSSTFSFCCARAVAPPASVSAAPRPPVFALPAVIAAELLTFGVASLLPAALLLFESLCQQVRGNGIESL